MGLPVRGVPVVLAACLILLPGAGEDAPKPSSAVEAALRQAEAESRKAVVFFRRKGPEGEPMARAYEASRDKLPDQARFLAVDADAPQESAAAKRYQIDRLDGPAILVLSPDGTLLAGFTAAPDVERIRRVLASRTLPGFQRAMALGSLLLVTVGDPNTETFKAMAAQAQAYADRAKGKAVLLQVDGTDRDEAFVLERLGVKAADGTVLCILKAGRPVDKFSGKVSVDQIEKSVAGCKGGGCGPDG